MRILAVSFVGICIGAVAFGGETRNSRVIPAESEPYVPRKIQMAGTHPLLQVPEKGKGLLQDSAAFARLSAEFSAPPRANTFWDSVAFHDSHKELISGKPKRAGVYLFFCTVYYTATEESFQKELGYDMTPETRRGLGGKKYARDFLKAVVMEGFGRLKTPVGEKNYIEYNGRWGYRDRILGNRSNTLVPRRSAAVHRRNKLFSKGTKITILSPLIHNVFGSIEWQAADTGGGLSHSQLDLYWGEDAPHGAGPDKARPAGTDFEKVWVVPVLIEGK